MHKSRLSEEQIAMAVKQEEAGKPVSAVCRKLKITKATFYRWKKKHGNFGVLELCELRQLREENRKLTPA